LQLLQFQLSKFRLDPQYVSTFQESMLQSTQAHLKNLYQELIAPVRNLFNAKHLVFVPHGLLHYVPFHALHDGESYLVDQFSVSYAPSASIYALCQQKQANTWGESLILGIPDAQAPSIADEVQALQSILPDSKLFMGSAATEEILRTQGPDSRIVLSLLDVHDRSTKEFMIAFYTRLQQGLSKPLALQGAMIELRERCPHPYYWAPFTLIGKV